MAPAVEQGLSLRLYALALLAFPRPIRATYRGEILAAFRAGLLSRRRLGAASARRYVRRAFVDALIAGARARWRPSGVRRSGPRAPLHRLAQSCSTILAGIWADVRLAFRSLARTPAFTLATLAILALGLGINGSIFTAVRAALLTPPPYPEPDRLVLLDLTLTPTDDSGTARPFPWSYPKYEMLAATGDLAADPIAAYAVSRLTLTERGDPVRLEAEVVTADYFRVLGVAPALGHDFAAGGDEPEREIVISHALWRERFGARPEIIGGEAVLNGEPVAVIGVASPGFRGLSGRSELWIPMASVPVLMSTSLLGNYDGHWLQSIGRLRPGASIQEASAQLQAVAGRVAEAFPWDDPTMRVGGAARRLQDARRNPRAQQAVIVLAAAAGLVLLVACANLAALMLARSAERQRETAVRLALGAPRLRVARAVLVETTVLALGGGLLAIVVTSQGVRALAAAWPSNFNDGGWNLRFVDAGSFSLGPATLAYTVGLALAAGLLFGLGPALRLGRADLGAALKEGARGSRAGRSGAGGRRPLVALEIAMALVLLIGAGLMVSSLGRLLSVDPGFDAERLLTFNYSLPRTSPRFEDPATFHEELLARLRALPGVTGATIGCAPLDQHCWISGVRRAGDRTWGEGERPSTGVQVVGSEFFETLGVRLLSGRLLGEQDRAGAPPVVVISESTAHELFPGASPLGQPFATGASMMSDGATAEIVGVVADLLYDDPAKGVMPEVFLSQQQEPPGGGATVLVRTAGEPLELVPAVRGALAELDPELPIYRVTTVADLGAGQVADTRAVMALLALFAAVALLLAAVGVWGVVAYTVTQRHRELGIRMALGAESRRVVAMVLREGLSSALWGTLVGVGAALLATRLLADLLYQVSPTDVRVFGGGALVLVLVAALAAYLPARRATRVDPVGALRYE